MDDRGEKIVTLARAMLNSDYLETPHSISTPTSRDLPLKAICVTALLAAFGSSAVTSAIEYKHQPISHYEKVELDALVFYASKQNDRPEDGLRLELQSKLRLPNLEAITSRIIKRLALIY